MIPSEQYPEPGPHKTAITVYTKPECVQCNQTKAMLNRRGIPYTTVDITTDKVALDYIKTTLGYRAAPVVVAWPETLVDPIDWNGFRPDLIMRHLTKDIA
ncbi:MAG: glutaredoxin family protein [Renibacterium salmoninarum]|nr:glutaredoxin family protein [Renibacterium salmoninarum]